MNEVTELGLRVAPDAGTVGGLGRLRLALGLLGIVAVYAPIFPSLVWEWATFSNLSHGFAIPFIAGYLVWSRRERLRRLAVIPTWAGLPVVIAGLALYTAGTLGQESFLARLSLPISLLGGVLLLTGGAVARVASPGIVYLFFMIPLPYLTLKRLTEQARLLDATVAAAVLPWLGVPVYQEGFFLHLSHMTLEVADACSSVPAIASLLALGAAYGIVQGRDRVARVVLLATAVPLGVVSNIVRIILTAAAVHFFGGIVLNSVVHMWSGATVFVMTFGALILVDAVIHRYRP